VRIRISTIVAKEFVFELNKSSPGLV
jgi:hypothetical protein